jgi:hypothetical protein
MSPQPTQYGDHFESAAETKSIVVNIDRATNGNYPALRFPSKGRVLGAYVFADVAASGTNTIQISLLNGGVTGAGTIITAPATAGTILAGSAYALTITTGGPEAYDVGELCMVKLTTSNATTDVSVQVDYHLDAY